jgi:flagellar hook-associated protein 3 FlgL
MRVSTSMLYQQGLDAMLRQQSQLARTQNQLATNQKWLSAADDPAGYASAQGMDRLLAQTAQYQSNAEAARHRLLLEEDALADGTSALQRVRELALQANSAGQSDASRATIAKELYSLRDQLLAVANRDDGQGRYLFAGSADAQSPFAWTGSSLSYSGDQQVRTTQIGSTRRIDEGDAGSTVFQDLKSGNGRFAVAADPANTGSAQLTASKAYDDSLWDGGRYTVEFTAGGYRVLDAGNTEIQAGSYTAGSAIRFRGAELSFSGTPSDGDRFDVAPSAQQDVIALVDKLARLVESPQPDAAARAQWQTALQQGLAELGSAESHFTDLRAGVGLRLSAVEDAATQLSAQQLHTKEALSDLRDLDYAEALTRLQQQMTALQAAQQTYMQVQSLSLFNYLR